MLNKEFSKFLSVGILLSISAVIAQLFFWYISPIRTINSADLAWSLLILFHLIFILTLSFLWFYFKSKKIYIGSNITEALNSVNIKTILIISIIGVILHLYAKSEVLITYGFENLSALRNGWAGVIGTEFRNEQSSFMRLASMSGWILSHFTMLALFISTYKVSKNILDIKGWMVIIFSMFLMGVFSFSIVTRTIFITVMMVVFTSGLISIINSNKVFQTLVSFTLVMIFVTTMAILFNSFIFLNKITTSDDPRDRTQVAYTNHNLDGYDAQIDKTYTIAKESDEATIKVKKTIINNFGTIVPTLFYLNHGIYNFIKITNTSERGESEFLRAVNRYAVRIGINMFDKSGLAGARVYSRGGATLPGSIYHDFGVIGIIIAAILMAIFYAFSLLLLSIKNFFWLGMSFLVSLSITILMSFLFVASSTISFPFVVFPFFAYFLYGGIKNKVTLKRYFDLLLVIIIIVLLALPILLISIAIRFTSKGPVLFWSDRVGKNNKIFKMPKFRSMKLGSPVVAKHLLKNSESYLSPIGGFLRKTSLDELPQLLSVFKGDMSLVGPRPALYNQDDLIFLRKKKGIDKLVPGITGWAQVNGRDEIIMAQKVALDEEYLKKQSIWFDAKILWITFLKFLKKEVAGH